MKRATNRPNTRQLCNHRHAGPTRSVAEAPTPPKQETPWPSPPTPLNAVTNFVVWDGTNDDDVISLSQDGGTTFAVDSSATPKTLEVSMYNGQVIMVYLLGSYLQVIVDPITGQVVAPRQQFLTPAQAKAAFSPATPWPASDGQTIGEKRVAEVCGAEVGAGEVRVGEVDSGETSRTKVEMKAMSAPVNKNAQRLAGHPTMAPHLPAG